ncbi:MAG: hypothetical protein GXX90_01900 [Microbacteriaceae bacterium]|nr:hypothetical protein [Microbacteriaceae bacterium]
MNTITDYIDRMFAALPSSDEVRRAKRELQQMSEDRYHELRAEGASENEAVGRVIAQFGNLDELADDLGIRAELDRSIVEPVRFSDGEAERFLEVQRRGSLLISGGVLAVLAGAAMLVGFEGAPSTASSGVLRFDGEPLGLLLFFLALALGVGMFIFAGVSMSRYSKNEGRVIELSPEASARYRARREAGTTRFALGIAGGVALILLSIAVSAVISGTGAQEGGALETIGIVITMLGIALAVGVLVVASMGRSALDRITAEGDYSPEKIQEDELIGRIAGPYWLLVLLVFLVWGFVFDGWERNWMVWPIGGVLFGLVAATIGAIRPTGRR